MNDLRRIHLLAPTLCCFTLFVLLACGCSLTSADEPVVRVLLTPKPVARFQIGFDSVAVVRSLTDDSCFGTLKPRPVVSVTATSESFVIGGTAIDGGVVELISENDVVRTRHIDYSGRFQFHRVTDNRFQVINVVPLEHYVASVVDGEMPVEFGSAARMSQAIAARTYVLFHLQHASATSAFDVHATVQSQRYLGLRYRSGSRWLSGVTPNARQAADKTRGLVIVRNRELICSYFSACCGGATTEGSGYFSNCQLASVACENCVAAPLYRWQRSMDCSEIGRTIRGQSASLIESLKPAGDSDLPDSYVLSVRGREVTIPRAELYRELLSEWPSDRFTLELRGGVLTGSGKGHGHGVGMCQWGARGMSRKGRTCLEILRHYYCDTDIVRLKFSGRSWE